MIGKDDIQPFLLERDLCIDVMEMLDLWFGFHHVPSHCHEWVIFSPTGAFPLKRRKKNSHPILSRWFHPPFFFSYDFCDASWHIISIPDVRLPRYALPLTFLLSPVRTKEKTLYLFVPQKPNSLIIISSRHTAILYSFRRARHVNLDRLYTC